MDRRYESQHIITSFDAELEVSKGIREELDAVSKRYVNYLERACARDVSRDWTRDEVNREDEIVLRVARKIGIAEELEEARALRDQRANRFRNSVEASLRDRTREDA